MAQVAHLFSEKAVLLECRTDPHPFIIRLAATFQDERHLYIAMECTSGGELLARLREAGQCSIYCPPLCGNRGSPFPRVRARPYPRPRSGRWCDSLLDTTVRHCRTSYRAGDVASAGTTTPTKRGRAIPRQRPDPPPHPRTCFLRAVQAGSTTPRPGSTPGRSCACSSSSTAGASSTEISSRRTSFSIPPGKCPPRVV